MKQMAYNMTIIKSKLTKTPQVSLAAQTSLKCGTTTKISCAIEQSPRSLRAKIRRSGARHATINDLYNDNLGPIGQNYLGFHVSFGKNITKKLLESNQKLV